MSTEAARSAGAMSTSTYAVLGLLAIGAQTAYELTGQMRRTLRFFWPRADSKLYEAPKLLASRGLANASRELPGRRPRTRYRITPAGKRRLRDWLARRDIVPLELESEALVRIWLGHLGTIDDLRAALESLSQQARGNLQWGRTIGTEYLVEGVPPGRGHVSALTFRFLWDFNQMLEAWSAWGLRELEAWDGVEPTAERMERAVAILREALDQH